MTQSKRGTKDTPLRGQQIDKTSRNIGWAINGTIALMLVFMVMLIAGGYCKGPQGEQGVIGEPGPQGEQGGVGATRPSG